jgi:ribosomal protein S18 acetylase RimI-like enzyme
MADGDLGRRFPSAIDGRCRRPKAAKGLDALGRRVHRLAMSIRAIEAQDLSELIDLRASTRENPFSRDALRQLGITEESTAALLRITHRGWLWQAGARIAGFAIGDGSNGEITVIAVRPEFEGQGIGSRLLAAVEAWLGSLGWAELWLWTSADAKTRAYGFYGRQGWTVADVKGEIAYFKKRMPPPLPGPAPAPVPAHDL